MSGTLIPGSFQVPNFYADRLLALLTDAEYKVLTYATRRTFGFRRESDRITVPQFCKGLTGADGNRLDYGTGLAESTVKTALATLARYGVLKRVSENDPHLNQGAEFAPAQDERAVDWDALEERFEGRQAKQKTKARSAEVGMLDTPTTQTPPGYVQHPQGGYVRHPHHTNKDRNPVETQRRGLAKYEEPPAPPPDDSYFANPAGTPKPLSPQREACAAAIFAFSGSTNADWIGKAEALWERYRAAGLEFTPAQLQQAAERGRELWREEGKSGSPRYFNSFERGMADTADALRREAAKPDEPEDWVVCENGVYLTQSQVEARTRQQEAAAREFREEVDRILAAGPGSPEWEQAVCTPTARVVYGQQFRKRYPERWEAWVAARGH